MIPGIISGAITGIIASLFVSYFLHGYSWTWKRLLPGSRRYTQEDMDALPERVVSVQVETKLMKGKVYYLGPTTAEKEGLHFWVLFPGRTGKGINWFKHLEPLRLEDHGFLAMDYPGYGDMKGAPSLDNIQATTQEALTNVGTIHGRRIGDKEWWTSGGRSLSVAGYSIGAALALDFALKNPVRRVVLLAPFSNVKDVVRRHHGAFKARLMRVTLDNVALLKKVLAKASPPEIIIVHDPEDAYIPKGMVEELQRVAPDKIRVMAVSGAGHHHLMSELSVDQKRDLFGGHREEGHK
ncbi:MAG: alpha/beta fold hydrolase [Candidatus Sumerlaeia bacterium]|nr:alpha/beta fold hydrolase [Candidatus Sumerlaeia bacterium]